MAPARRVAVETSAHPARGFVKMLHQIPICGRGGTRFRKTPGRVRCKRKSARCSAHDAKHRAGTAPVQRDANSEESQITSIRLIPRTEAITRVGSGIDLRVTHPSPSATPSVASPLNAACRGWWRNRIGNRIRQAPIPRWWGTKFRRWSVARWRTIARCGSVRRRWSVGRWRWAIPRRWWRHIRSAGRQSRRAEQQRQ
jgi:hypothetical protein